MITRRRQIVVAIAALGVALACGGGVSGSDDNGTGLPDGTVKSKTFKSRDNYEICVKPEGGGAVKCKSGWTKDSVKNCSVGSFWPDCYHLPVKGLDRPKRAKEEVTTW